MATNLRQFVDALRTSGQAANAAGPVAAGDGPAGGLPSPSYVNNQDPNPNLTGGATASAGDSYFVTGGQKSDLLAKVNAIRKAATALYEVAKKIGDKGKGGMLGGENKSLLESAKDIKGVADAMVKLASAIDQWTGNGNKDSIAKGSKAVEYVSKLITAAEAVGAMKDLSVSADEMAKKPNQASVEAWADNVGNTFDKAAGLIGFIPTDGLPGFIVDYYKGLFSAPKNYINAFKTIMHAHYAAIDAEAFVFEGGSNTRAVDGEKTVWQGVLTGVFIGACFQSKAKDGTDLQSFMKAHKDTEGQNLYKLKDLNVAKALLSAAIVRDAPEDVKDAWGAYVDKG